MNALVEEQVEDVSSAKKEKSFPTAAVVGLGAMIMILSAVTGMVCLRRNDKTNSVAEAAAESPANVESDEQLEKAPTSESGSAEGNSE